MRVSGRSTTSSLHLLFGLLPAALAMSGCNGSGETTTGKRLTLSTKITADASDAAFTNAFGWSITLSRAHLSVGALHYFDGAPLFARRSPTQRSEPPLRERIARWLVPEAHAHPGHYEEGEVKGEMLTSTSVDLLAAPTDLADAAALDGVYRSARFAFGAPPAGPFADELDGAVVSVEGRAEKGSDVRVFRARAGVADVRDAAGEPVVEGCVFEEIEVEEAGVVTFLVKPAVWLDQVDFTELTPTEGGAPVDLPADGTPHRGFSRGLKKGTAYLFSFAPGTAEEQR